jgi:hypothetical protein
MRFSSQLIALCALVFLVGPSTVLAEPTIWSGPLLTFSKPGFALPSQVYDRLTDNVFLARGNSQGLFNIHAENLFGGSVSPRFTEWATDLNNPGKTIDAGNWAALSFTNWTAAYNSAIGNNFNRDAVVYLTQEDIYLNLRFTTWGSGSTGGEYSYIRSTPVPEPAFETIALTAVFLTSVARRRG